MADSQPVEDAIVAEEEEVAPVEVDTETEVTELAEGEEKAEVTEDPKPEEPSPSKKDGKTRIKELNTKYREAERERDYWRQQAQTPQDSQPAPVGPDKTLADFEYDEGKFASYLTDRATADARTEVDKKIAQDHAARSQSEFAGKEADFSEEIDDYHSVTRSNDLKITGDMIQVLQESDDGPAALYYLGKNPDVAERLSRMSPLNMARELGRIEATKLTVEKPPSVTNAPAPAPKITGAAKPSAISATSADSDTLSGDEWLKRRNKQLSAR